VQDDGTKQGFRRLWLLLVLAALAEAWRTQRDHGELFGFIPYDFRMPTLERARARTWNPSSPRILTPATFGVGWSLNLGRLARLARLA
jgi:hypothetical protein